MKEVNNTFIALIPKIENPLTINNYRSISLCNTTLKIITKDLANILKHFLHKIIHPLHGTFVEGRAIQDNILIAHEIFRSKKGKSWWMILKLDMEKAYDMLNWDFIKQVINKFGFHKTWIGWVMTTIKSVTFSA